MGQIVSYKPYLKTFNDLITFLNIKDYPFLEINLFLLNITISKDKNFQNVKTVYFDTYNDLESVVECIWEMLKINLANRQVKLVEYKYDKKSIDSIDLNDSQCCNLDEYLKVFKIKKLRYDLLNRKMYLIFDDERFLFIYSKNWNIPSDMNTLTSILINKYKLKLIGSLQ